MAKVDNIIQQIRNAQATAIAKNGGITANSYAKVEADTKSILQKQIAQQQSAKKETSGQAETPALSSFIQKNGNFSEKGIDF